MYIHEIILDGFKSYANRTVVSDFDCNFNAITGLNGSGKSNILDAICFVLGITQLQSVRVNNLQELVYKQGQARVTKASVSIVFDNRDKKKSPAGYEYYDQIVVTRQIIVGGRTKYLINGHTAQVNRVQSMFQSVLLNINNPHFLIMQGKITKVLGMKPLEILGMIEEAAGTRMYEMKRNNAQRIIKRKEIKLNQIESSLNEEITPLLEKLRKQKTHYLTWSSNNTEIERLKRFNLAFHYHSFSAVAGKQKVEKKRLLSNEKLLEKNLIDISAELKSTKLEIDELESRKCEMETAEILLCDKTVSEMTKRLTKEKAILGNKEKVLEEERGALREVNAALKSAQEDLQNTQKANVENKADFENAKENADSLKEKLECLQGQQLGFSVENEANSKGSLTSQLIQCRREKAELESQLKNIEFRLGNLMSQLEKKEREVKSTNKEDSQINSDITDGKNRVKMFKKQIDFLKEKVKKSREINEKINELNQKISANEQKRNQNSIATFHYRSPTPNFDDSKVFGYLAELFTAKEEKFIEALEVSAGGKLRNVVIESQDIGRQLLKKGQLERRVTMIPLDRVVAHPLPHSRIIWLKDNLGRSDIWLATECINNKEKFDKAMDFAFGKTVVCPDLQIAKKCAFGSKQRLRTVTLSGELFEPHGTVTGGYRARSASILANVQRARRTADERDRLNAEMETVQTELNEMSPNLEKYRKLKNELQIAEHELNALERRAKNSGAGSVREGLEKLREDGKNLAKEKKRLEEEIALKVKRVGELEKDKDNHGKSSKDVEKTIKNLKMEVVSFEKKLKESRSKVDYDEIEIKSIKKEIEKNSQLKLAVEENVNSLTAELQEIKETVSKTTIKLESATERLKRTNVILSKLIEEIESKTLLCGNFEDRKEEKSLALKKTQNELNRFDKSHREAKLKVNAMEKEHKWINDEKHLFGKEGSDFDFDAIKPDFVKARLKNLTEQQEELSSRINKKVLVMFDKAEQDYQGLLKKREIVLKDKQKIEKVIEELDHKKDEMLNLTFETVNKHFTEIFQQLLPGASAKLVKLDVSSILKGVEVHVAFGSAWKDSLSELSGGQRSLLALALILSLLLFRPAPVYILDEIDAALDISHTENIGRLLSSSKFAKAQFIVVSLKDGMFNNANALFQVRFQKGVSAVRRIAGKRKDLNVGE